MMLGQLLNLEITRTLPGEARSRRYSQSYVVNVMSIPM